MALETGTVNVNPDLKKERANATFDREILTSELNGGLEKVRRRRHLINLALQTPEFEGPDLSFLSREELYDETLRRHIAVLKRLKEWDITDREEAQIVLCCSLPRGSSPLVMHELAFLTPITVLGTEEQKAKWLPLARQYKILGCYAQTELGHGSNVRAIETSATYDPQTRTFDLHTPTQTATKWWVGNMGKTMTHALVMAQLYSKGHCYGPHLFIVQIRDLKTHMPMAGMEIGDIGPKFGMNEVDHGYAIFNHVKLPRDSMLMGASEVTVDGDYVVHGDPRLQFAGMLDIRTGLVKASGLVLSRACTIAIRYSAVRRQSEPYPGAPEPQVIDYQTQQFKLFPWLSLAYGLMFSGDAIHNKYSVVMDEVRAGKMHNLAELHGLTASMKAYSTVQTMHGIERLRLACGGHGYSLASGLPQLYTGAAVSATAEGEATVMYLQGAKFLLKSYNAAQSGGSRLPESVQYLGVRVHGPVGLGTGLNPLLMAFQTRTTRLLSRITSRLDELVKGGQSKYQAHQRCQQRMVDACIASCVTFTLSSFMDKIGNVKDKATRDVLTQLCELYALYEITENAGDFLQHNVLTAADISQAMQRLLALLASIRVNAVVLVDAFEYPDRMLDSILGRYDGNVYENLYRWAKSSPLNKTEVHESYHKYLGPFMKKARL